ncbi:MAG: hypothetical protein BM563_06925 [Bacteroidetes bacterium MedPE-SWsnd-G1]|nr:MAG: hypothetical protein BM563_06925 [Bacteroidetes bacterium MedPE-SWsnd-G1]
MKKLTLFLILWCHVLFSQEISGHIYDINTKEPLVGATIYLDGTTLGTNSDFEGFFKLDIRNANNAKVIISYIGYDTRVFSILELDPNLPIHLTESNNQIPEVKLKFDMWSRSKKLHIFKQEFLGKEFPASRCKIENEKDIVLIHNANEGTLTAYSKKPIRIINKYLGYEVNYNLIDFEIEFSNHFKGSSTPVNVYYAGTSFYSELDEKTRNSILNNRKRSYKGSLLHFMRSLSNKELNESKFVLYYSKNQVTPYKYFKLSAHNNAFKKVNLTVEKITVVYKNKEQSIIQLSKKDQSTFYIDRTGNYSPTNALLFNGTFGRKRMASTLPLNYNLN